MFGDIGDFFSNLFSGGSSSPSGWDFGPLSDSFLGGGLDPVSGMNLGSMGVNPTGWDFGPLSDSLLSGGVDPVSGMSLSQMNPSFIDSLIKQATKDPLGSASKVLKSLTGSEQPADWAKLLGSLGAAGLGAYASNKQSSAMDNLAQRYEGYGAPYRQKLSDLYKNPSSFLNSDEVQKPVQMGTDALMRSLSTKGNPFGSGNALQQGQSYASDQLFGRLGQEKDRLAGFGGLASYNGAAPQVASNAIGSNANMYNAIGSGLGNIFNPPKSSAQTMAEFMKSTGG